MGKSNSSRSRTGSIALYRKYPSNKRKIFPIKFDNLQIWGKRQGGYSPKGKNHEKMKRAIDFIINKNISYIDAESIYGIPNRTLRRYVGRVKKILGISDKKLSRKTKIVNNTSSDKSVTDDSVPVSNQKANNGSVIINDYFKGSGLEVRIDILPDTPGSRLPNYNEFSKMSKNPRDWPPEWWLNYRNAIWVWTQ